MRKNDIKEILILAIVIWFLADIFGLITWGPLDMILDIIGKIFSPFRHF